MKKVLFTMMLVGLAVSAQAMEHDAVITVADAQMVEGCRKVGNLTGVEGYRYFGPPEVLAGTQPELARQAETMGATHIFFHYEDSGLKRTLVGSAFDCTGKEMVAKR